MCLNYEPFSEPLHISAKKFLNSELARCEAFAMGQQERLGAGSLVRGLEPAVVRMVLKPALEATQG